MTETRAQWFAFSSLFRADPAIEALGEEFGAEGPFLIVGLLCEAKLQGRGGRVEGSLRVLAHDCFIEDRDRAAEIIKAAGETDVIEVESLDDRAFVVRVTNWSRWQEAFRKASSRAKNKESGQLRTPPDNSGRDRTKTDAPVARTDTDTETTTTTSPVETADAELCHLLADLVAGNDPNGKRPTVTKEWAVEEDRMFRIDKRKPAEARRLIEWTQANAFWRKNVRSMPKFREQYGRLYLAAVEEAEKRKAATPTDWTVTPGESANERRRRIREAQGLAA